MSRPANPASHPTASDDRLQEQLKGRLKERIARQLEAHPFQPPRWLRNPHAQTVWSRYGHQAALPEMRLERWDTPDDDFLRLHFWDGNADRPTALLLHGLEGCVESTYIVRLVNRLAAMQWNVVVMEHRSCGGEMNRARRLYHSGWTGDLDFVVRGLIETRDNPRLYIAGYSLGGNATAKWLGESSATVPGNVHAAAIVSAPYSLLDSAPFMDSGIRRLYVRHFLRMLIPKAIEKERQYPGCLDVDLVRRCKTFRDFDHHATAALHGFADAEDYYAQSGCGQFLHGIRVPTLLLSAADDPFNPPSTLPLNAAEKSPYLHPAFTDHGGHVGFVGRSTGSGLAYWAEEQVARFFSACDLELDK